MHHAPLLRFLIFNLFYSPCQFQNVHRWMMVHMAVDSTFGSRYPVKVLDFEMYGYEHSPGTYQLVQDMRQQYPLCDFSVIVGADLLDHIRSWTSPGVKKAGGNCLQSFLSS
jgi:nicotinic acid mononucleotide adenylyltransferase